jgi:hypothetical protein
MLSLSFIMLLVGAGCGDDGSPGVDSGPGLDGGPGDSGGRDGAPGDGGGDDGGADAGADGGGPDGGSPDGGGGGWAWCPRAEDYVGSASWPHAVVATDSAIYCATFDESRTLREELDLKALLRVVPGRYPMPDVAGPVAFYLPVCLDFGDGMPPARDGTGTVMHSQFTYMGNDSHQNNVRQSFLVDGASREMQIDIRLVGPEGMPATHTLDGSTNDVFGETVGSWTVVLCGTGEECYYPGARRFDSCDHATSSLHRHTLALFGGDPLVLELRIGVSAASTEPGAFVRAAGTFRGTAFDQRDYFRLVYNPEHHHFSRDFAVFFDAPIDGACGLEIINLESFDSDFQPDQAFTIDCDLNRIEEVAVMSHDWEVVP